MNRKNPKSTQKCFYPIEFWTPREQRNRPRMTLKRSYLRAVAHIFTEPHNRPIRQRTNTASLTHIPGARQELVRRLPVMTKRTDLGLRFCVAAITTLLIALPALARQEKMD